MGGSASNSNPVTAAKSGTSNVNSSAASELGQLPNYYSLLEQLMPGYTNSTVNASNAAQAGTQAQGATLFSQLAPSLNNTTANLGAQNLQSNANAIGSTLNSQGANSIYGGFQSGQQAINPGYNSSMANLASIASSQNPNALSGSEQAQITRGLNQSNFSQGNQNVQNPLTNINNALTFGSGLQQKQSDVANLLGTTANTANTLNSGQNSFGLATNQPSGTSSANTSATPNQFLTSPNTTFGTGSLGSTLGLNSLAGLNSTYNSSNSALAGQTSSGSASGQLCVFALILGRESIPWYIRAGRDCSYQQDPYLQDGYTLFANIICRLIWIPFMFWITKKFIVDPLVRHAGYVVKDPSGKFMPNYAEFWVGCWSLIGKLKHFIK